MCHMTVNNEKQQTIIGSWVEMHTFNVWPDKSEKFLHNTALIIGRLKKGKLIRKKCVSPNLFCYETKHGLIWNVQGCKKEIGGPCWQKGKLDPLVTLNIKLPNDSDFSPHTDSGPLDLRPKEEIPISNVLWQIKLSEYSVNKNKKSCQTLWNKKHCSFTENASSSGIKAKLKLLCQRSLQGIWAEL